MGIISSIKEFFYNLKNEVKGLEVPGFVETIGYFTFILIIITIVGLFVYISDIVLKFLVRLILDIFN